MDNPNTPKWSTSTEQFLWRSQQSQWPSGWRGHSSVPPHLPLTSAISQHFGLTNPMPSNHFLHWSSANFPSREVYLLQPISSPAVSKEKAPAVLHPSYTQLNPSWQKNKLVVKWVISGFQLETREQLLPIGSSENLHFPSSCIVLPNVLYSSQGGAGQVSHLLNWKHPSLRKKPVNNNLYSNMLHYIYVIICHTIILRSLKCTEVCFNFKRVNILA